jgi:hypothetical protein
MSKAKDLSLELVKDPIAKVVLQHEERIRRLETYVQIGVTVAGLGVALLAAILTVLVERL